MHLANLILTVRELWLKRQWSLPRRWPAIENQNHRFTFNLGGRIIWLDGSHDYIAKFYAWTHACGKVRKYITADLDQVGVQSKLNVDLAYSFRSLLFHSSDVWQLSSFVIATFWCVQLASLYELWSHLCTYYKQITRKYLWSQISDDKNLLTLT